MKGSEDVLLQHMKAQNMSFAEVAENRGRGRELVGTAEMVADRLQDIFESGVCDGFVVSPVNHPGMFEQFCRSVVPELQRRGLFRQDYAGKTMRENLRS
jgi:alkanesulfonate monooxygenase SsuD/methylene tetrahydromethanopterin reductase-like flavin-dependent oxidoreductase (luciferase family)